MSNDTEAYATLTPQRVNRWDSIERGILATTAIAACCLCGVLAGLAHTHLMRGLLTLAMIWSISEFTRILVSPR